MKRTFLSFIFLFVMLVIFSGCNSPEHSGAQGKLFIIGGGERPPALMQKMLDASGIGDDDYIIVLPFSSSEPLESSIYVREQLHKLGAPHLKTLFLNSDSLLSQAALDSVREAGLIYITGGDQNLFMQTSAKTGLSAAIHNAFDSGAMISGTSAGAAVMSKKMITGNQLSLAAYSGNFRTIHENNIEISEGLGLLKNVIIDQHFIRRMRMNRLISVAIENPDEMCVGIDESTAILVEGNKATVVGSSQVVVLTNNGNLREASNGLLGADDIHLKVILPNQSFSIN